MTLITRTTHVQYDTTALLAVEGRGTTKFLVSGAPDLCRVKTIGVVFSGPIRITRLASGEGFNVVRIGKGSMSADRRRVFFRSDAKIRLGSRVVSMSDYWKMLVAVNGE